MKKRQLEKILNSYVLDTDGVTLLPPSVYRHEDREMDVYYSKAWRLSHPKEAADMDKAISEAIKECECNCEGEGECHCGCHCEK